MVISHTINLLYVKVGLNESSVWASNEYSWLFDALEALPTMIRGNVISLGDFIVPDYFVPGAGSATLEIVNNFDTVFNLNQCISVFSAHSRLLDLVFSDLPCIVSRCNDPVVVADYHQPPLDISYSDIVK